MEGKRKKERETKKKKRGKEGGGEKEERTIISLGKTSRDKELTTLTMGGHCTDIEKRENRERKKKHWVGRGQSAMTDSLEYNF